MAPDLSHSGYNLRRQKAHFQKLLLDKAVADHASIVGKNVLMVIRLLPTMVLVRLKGAVRTRYVRHSECKTV